ncbi:MAG: DUF6460 domain-containing protein [Methyloceanibacter sp.]
MERFFGGNPALVLVRLVVLSLIVGVVLAALGFSPFDIIESLQRLVARIYDMGFVAVEKALRYFLLGAVIVFPVWLVMRVLKVMGRSSGTEVLDPSSRNRELSACRIVHVSLRAAPGSPLPPCGGARFASWRAEGGGPRSESFD